jgi:RHS repeat-associated protein
VRWGNRDWSGESSSGRSLDNYFRTYDATVGRYLEPDRVGQEGGIHLYRYAAGNPVNFLDVLGLVTFKKGVPRDTLSKNVSGEFDLIDSVAINQGIPEREVTSTTDVDPNRVGDTKHTSGNACDLRAKDLTDQEQDEFARGIADALGPAFDVVSEHVNSNSNKDHVHVEYDPQPGKTRNFFIKRR